MAGASSLRRKAIMGVSAQVEESLLEWKSVTLPWRQKRQDSCKYRLRVSNEILLFFSKIFYFYFIILFYLLFF